MQQKNYRIPLYYAMVTLFWMALYTYVPILSTYSLDMGATAAMAGTIISAYGLMQAVLRIPLGIMSDMTKKRKLYVIAGCVCALFSAVGMVFANAPWQLMLARGLAGVAASSWVVASVLFGSYFAAGDSAKSMARVTVFNNIGQMTAMFLGGQAAQLWGGKAAFLLAVGCGLAATVSSLFIIEKVDADAAPKKIMEFVRVAGDKTLLVASIVGILYQIINQGATMGFTPAYAREIGASTAQQGMLSAITIGGMVVTSYLSSRFLITRFGQRKLVLVGFMLMGVCTVIISQIKSPALLLCLQFIVGLGNGLSYPLLMGLAIKNIDPARRGAAMGFFQAVYGIGMFVGPWLAGQISDAYTSSLAILIIGLFGFVAFAISWFALERVKK